MKNTLLILAALLPLAACNTLKKDFGKGEPQPKFDNTPYSQLVTGNATGPSVQTLKAVFAPNKVTAYWSYKHPTLGCAPIGADSQIPTFSSVQGNIGVYAVVTIDGLSVTADFRNIDNSAGCWAIKSEPNISASSHELY